MQPALWVRQASTRRHQKIGELCVCVLAREVRTLVSHHRGTTTRRMTLRESVIFQRAPDPCHHNVSLIHRSSALLSVPLSGPRICRLTTEYCTASPSASSSLPHLRWHALELSHVAPLHRAGFSASQAAPTPSEAWSADPRCSQMRMTTTTDQTRVIAGRAHKLSSSHTLATRPPTRDRN